MAEVKRLTWIDCLRALAIFGVVYGHCSQDNHFFFLFTSPVKMPLFFAITGFLLKDDIGVSSFFKGILQKLIIPWFFLGLFPIIFQVPTRGFAFFLSYFVKMIEGEVIWFMPCFIYGQIIHFLIRKYLNKTSYIVAVTMLCVLVGFFWTHRETEIFTTLNRAMIVQAFFFIGFIFKRYSHIFFNLKKVYFGVGVMLYFLLGVLSERFFPGESIDVHLNHYCCIPFSFLFIFLGVFLLFYIAPKINFHFDWIKKIGQNTLVIYIWHGYAVALFAKLLTLFNVDYCNIYGIAMLKTIFACATCCLLSILLNRLCPYLIGKRPRE